MKYYKGMKIITLEDCELPHDMRAETFTIVDSSQSDSLQVEDYRGRVLVIDKGYVDEKATRKLNQTKADFNKKFKFDEIEIELQFNQAYSDDTDIFINIVDYNSEIFTTITTKQAKKLIKHLQKMVDYVEE
ncbi:MAG TPA: hypothetical protein PKI46_03885 [Bacteroidales bacterium]|nr:hypothetical protein [Bacteroidales bacterium]